MPQRMTKIINEGWASFWHSRLLTEGLLDATEVVEFADCHSGATQVAFRGSSTRTSSGSICSDTPERQGMDLFQLRSVHNDVSFVDAVLDDDFVRGSNLFVMERGRPARRAEDRDARSGAGEGEPAGVPGLGRSAADPTGLRR